MRALVLAIACAVFVPLAHAAAPAGDPALYSFADVYRMTVSGAMSARPAPEAASGAAAPDAPIRVSAARAAPAEPRFVVSPVRRHEKWILILAGLALAGWVAHRRLAHGL